MKRKLVASLLIGTMLLGTSLTAFAEDTSVETPGESGLYEAEVKGEAAPELPTIKVTVPTTANLALNPYKMEVENEEGDTLTDKIVTVDSVISNESDVKVAVNVSSFKATVGTDSAVVFASAPFTEGKEPTTKSVFAYLDIVGEDEEHKPFDKTADGQLVLSDKAAKKDNMFVLDAEDGTAKFAIKGDVASKPTIAWTEKDTFETSLKFTFTPQVMEDAD